MGQSEAKSEASSSVAQGREARWKRESYILFQVTSLEIGYHQAPIGPDELEKKKGVMWVYVASNRNEGTRATSSGSGTPSVACNSLD